MNFVVIFCWFFNHGRIHTRCEFSGSFILVKCYCLLHLLSFVIFLLWPDMGKKRDSSSSRSSSRSRSRHRSRSAKRRGRRSRSASGDKEGVRVHISDLPVSCTESELRKTFEKFGRLVEVWKTNSTPCFAFIVFHRKDDADEAIRGLNGQ